MKQATCIVFVVAFLAQTFSRGFIELGYYFNKAAYQRACENKARPSMHCNGKCQMMKKIRKQEEQTNKVPEKRAEKFQEVFSPLTSFECLAADFSSYDSHKYFTYRDGQLLSGSRLIFQPPD